MSDYITVADLKDALSLTGTTYADSSLSRVVSAASRAVEEATGRRYWLDPDANQQRQFLPENPGYCLIDDLAVFTSLTYLGDTWTLGADFRLEPLNAAADGRPYTAIRAIGRPFVFTRSEIPTGWAGFDGTVTVTGQWGWPSVPAQIVEATMILASRLLRRDREAPFGVVAVGIDGAAVSIARTDPDVAALLAPFSRSLIA